MSHRRSPCNWTFVSVLKLQNSPLECLTWNTRSIGPRLTVRSVSFTLKQYKFNIVRNRKYVAHHCHTPDKKRICLKWSMANFFPYFTFFHHFLYLYISLFGERIISLRFCAPHKFLFSHYKTSSSIDKSIGFRVFVPSHVSQCLSFSSFSLLSLWKNKKTIVFWKYNEFLFFFSYNWFLS